MLGAVSASEHCKCCMAAILTWMMLRLQKMPN
jgi:uncharacterized protein YjiS (DUF1127 family)